MMSKRIIGMLLVLLLLFVAAACDGSDGAGSSAEEGTPTSVPSGDPTDDPSSAPSGYKDGVIGENKAPAWGTDGDAPAADEMVGGEMADMELPEGVYGGEPGESYGDPYGTGNGYGSAGTLTAGEWRDTSHIDYWRELFDRQEWAEILHAREFYADHIAVVTVLDGDDPVFQEQVALYTANDELVYTARSDIYGKAYLCYPETYLNEELFVRVGDTHAGSFLATGHDEVSVSVTGQREIDKLDLLLMIDTTGSMGDELEYIKTELVDMVNRIAEAGRAISIRVSVNFYRDEGDEYVVKYYDFRTDVNECLAQMREQHAEGGGDYPEAVHTALDNAVNGHDWREDAVKLCFFVLDAPPHSESEVQGVNKSILRSIVKASELGIKIVPVASSGVDTETEVILRSFAVMTGGTYIFLTNDSGIGESHLEPTVGEYTVEPLNECMIRVISEFCGLPYQAQTVYEPSEPPAGNLPDDPSLELTPPDDPFADGENTMSWEMAEYIRALIVRDAGVEPDLCVIYGWYDGVCVIMTNLEEIYPPCGDLFPGGMLIYSDGELSSFNEAYRDLGEACIPQFDRFMQELIAGICLVSL